MPLVTLVAITLTTMVHHDYSCKGQNPGFNETNGSFTKCHMSQFLQTIYLYIFNQILPMLAS
jgi:hypothetical protein